MIIPHSLRRSPRNKNRITTPILSTYSTTTNTHSLNSLATASLKAPNLPKSPKKRARKSISEMHKSDLSSPTSSGGGPASPLKTSLRTRKSSRMSMDASMRANLLASSPPNFSAKPDAYDSSPPATPTPVLSGSYPELHKESCSAPGGMPMPSPLRFDFTFPSDDSNPSEGEAVNPIIQVSGPTSSVSQASDPPSYPQTRSQTRAKPNLSVRIPHPSAFFISRRSSNFTKSKHGTPTTSRCSTPCPSPLLNPQFKHLIPVSSDLSLSDLPSAAELGSRVANTPRSLTPQLPITPLEQVMRPPSAPPPLNPAPVVRAPRGRKDIGMMPAPDVFTPMELTFANVSGMEVEVDITVSGALQSPTEMDIDVDFEPSLPCASNVTDRERSDPHPRWGSSLKNSSLSSLPERSKSFSHASRSSTPTQILSTHSVLSHTPHHSRLGIPYSGRAQTPPSSMYLSPLASPYEIPSPPSHSHSHTLAQSPSMPFIKKLSGSSSSSVHFSPNLRASASVRPSPLVRSMSLSALEQDIGEGMGMIRQEMGLGLGLIVEGEGERTPNLSSESEKGYFDLIMTNRGSTYAEAEQ